MKETTNLFAPTIRLAMKLFTLGGVLFLAGYSGAPQFDVGETQGMKPENSLGEFASIEENEPYSCAKNRKEADPNSSRTRSEEIRENAARAGVPDAELVKLQNLVEKYEGASKRRIQQKIGDEIIFESQVSQTQIITPYGVIKCVTSDRFTDTLLNANEGIMFRGGPLDNQNKEK